jgi:drug/metabolite transporter (DMT)-like permease
VSAAVGATRPIDVGSLALVAMMTLVWGCNWPILKIGVSELAPLTFRMITLPFSGLGLLLVARLSGESLAVPRALWPWVAVQALFNITVWNALVAFGLREMDSGRGSILAYTMPIWAVLLSVWLIREPLGRRGAIGLVLGMSGMAVLLGDDLRAIGRSPTGTALILMAAVNWAVGTLLMRRWRTPLPQTTQVGWMMLVGSLPLLALVPVFDHAPFEAVARLSVPGWVSVLYNTFGAGIIAHWVWFRLARSLPVAVSSMSVLPVPIVGVISGMLVLGEQPGPAELAALALVAGALAVIYWPARGRPATAG